MTPLLYVSNSILRVVCEMYLVKESGTVIDYLMGHRRFFIIIYNLAKGGSLFAVLTMQIL